MNNINPMYQVLSSLYDAHTLASSSVPGVVQAMQYPLNRQPLQIQGGAARRAPTPQQQESGSGGLMGALVAGASLFEKGGPLYSLAGGSSAGSLFGNLSGQFNSGYFNTNTATGLASYLNATAGL